MIHAIMPAMRGHAGSVLFPRDTHPHDTIDVVIDSPRWRSLRAVATRECWLRVRVSQLESQSSHHRQLGGSNMRTITFAIALFATALIGALSGSFAQAQALRTFVSGTGSDSNPCTLALPCRTFQYAHDNTAAGGEIDVLTPGGYGPLTISKAISVEGHDYAGITA